MAQWVGGGIALLFHDRGTTRGEWSAVRPGSILPPGKTRYPFYRRLGGPQGRSGRAENLVPTGIFLKLNPSFIHCVLCITEFWTNVTWYMYWVFLGVRVAGVIPHYVRLNTSSVLCLCWRTGGWLTPRPLPSVVSGRWTGDVRVVVSVAVRVYRDIFQHNLLSGGFVVVFPSGTS